MIYSVLISIFIGGLIVAAQSLWKHAIGLVGEDFSIRYLLSKDSFSFFFSPYLIGGLIIYGFATLLYFLSLSKYQYSVVQTVVVSSSLIFTFLSAQFLFHEGISTKQIIGLAILLLGVWLIVNK